MEHVTEQQLTRRQSTVWRALRAAAPQTIPVLAGYFVLGMGYGIYVQSLGLPVWMPMLMGTVVYGGSLEFVLASLLLSAFSPLSAFLMALMIQARHLFYGLAMLERYKGYGLRSFYMIFAMSDETFSITCSAEPPEGVDRGWFMFFITLLDQCYWVASAGLGAVVGSVLPFSTEGVDFVMTAMFTVIFLNQWEKDEQHYSALIGLAAPLVCLVGVEQGPDRGAECGFFGGILCYLAGATPWQMALLALLGGLSGVIFHKASSFWGKWLTCLAALAGLEVLLVLGHCLAGASVFAGLRIAGPELLLSAACFPLAVLLTRLKGHPRRKRKGW
mgnify:CR=1 FL=1